jgi:hypothetical protein
MLFGARRGAERSPDGSVWFNGLRRSGREVPRSPAVMPRESASRESRPL